MNCHPERSEAITEHSRVPALSFSNGTLCCAEFYSFNAMRPLRILL